MFSKKNQGNKTKEGKRSYGHSLRDFQFSSQDSSETQARSRPTLRQIRRHGPLRSRQAGAETTAGSTGPGQREGAGPARGRGRGSRPPRRAPCVSPWGGREDWQRRTRPCRQRPWTWGARWPGRRPSRGTGGAAGSAAPWWPSWALGRPARVPRGPAGCWGASRRGSSRRAGCTLLPAFACSLRCVRTRAAFCKNRKPWKQQACTVIRHWNSQTNNPQINLDYRAMYVKIDDDGSSKLRGPSLCQYINLHSFC